MEQSTSGGRGVRSAGAGLRVGLGWGSGGARVGLGCRGRGSRCELGQAEGRAWDHRKTKTISIFKQVAQTIIFKNVNNEKRGKFFEKKSS
jgi:hypothetical protein